MSVSAMGFPKHRQALIGFEQLEGRALPSTFVAVERSRDPLTELMPALVLAIRSPDLTSPAPSPQAAMIAAGPTTSSTADPRLNDVVKDTPEGTASETPPVTTITDHTASVLNSPPDLPGPLRVQAILSQAASEGRDVNPVWVEMVDRWEEMREDLHDNLWAVPVSADASLVTASVSSRSPFGTARGSLAAEAENVFPIVADPSVQWQPGVFWVVPAENSTAPDSVTSLVEPPSPECPITVIPSAEPEPTMPTGTMPTWRDTLAGSLLAGVIPVDLATLEGEAREFLGHVANLGVDWPEGIDSPESSWLTAGVLLVGGVAYTMLVHRQRNRIARVGAKTGLGLIRLEPTA